ncbi:hypothetical protein F383_13585 [Gossypium arboreum]|uniref:Uncharacterized protein n=1 Tax=Gossypium arboreum TaxID=29729 RepID=A0A0B0PUN3_GOSAR|nr:hypothetical protein F383_13585 [Gossypium arboreum]
MMHCMGMGLYGSEEVY